MCRRRRSACVSTRTSGGRADRQGSVSACSFGRGTSWLAVQRTVPACVCSPLHPTTPPSHYAALTSTAALPQASLWASSSPILPSCPCEQGGAGVGGWLPAGVRGWRVAGALQGHGAAAGSRVVLGSACLPAVHTGACSRLPPSCPLLPLMCVFLLCRGFEHGIANMYLIPLSMCLGSGISVGERRRATRQRGAGWRCAPPPAACPLSLFLPLVSFPAPCSQRLRASLPPSARPICRHLHHQEPDPRHPEQPDRRGGVCGRGLRLLLWHTSARR